MVHHRLGQAQLDALGPPWAGGNASLEVAALTAAGLSPALAKVALTKPTAAVSST